MREAQAATEHERTSGVHSYQELYLDLDYVPAATDLLVAFAITPRQDTPMEEAAAAVAAESSTGTWTEVGEDDEGLAFELRARVYRIADNVALIAYPIDLFEFGSIPNILSSVVGNVFGFKAVSALRLLDMRVPDPLVDSFPGPAFGIAGVREKLNVHGRAMTGSTIKPKLGLSPAEHAGRAYETLRGGIDTIKDDENLNSQSWSPFDERIRQTLELVRQAEAETGERKGYWANVTAANTEEMLRRANLVADEGGRFVMVDFLTAGFAATASLRAETERLGLGAACAPRDARGDGSPTGPRRGLPRHREVGTSHGRRPCPCRHRGRKARGDHRGDGRAAENDDRRVRAGRRRHAVRPVVGAASNRWCQLPRAGCTRAMSRSSTLSSASTRSSCSVAGCTGIRAAAVPARPRRAPPWRPPLPGRPLITPREPVPSCARRSTCGRA